MAKKPDVSIVIVNWNTRALLLQCIGSILETTHGASLEIIVVDNGSEDDSAQAVASAYPSARVIQNGENLGFAKANNIGMRLAQGEFLCLVNSDVIVLPGAVEEMLRYIRGNPGIGILGPRLLNPDMSLQPSCKYFPTLRTAGCHAVGLNAFFPRNRYLCGEHMPSASHVRIRECDVMVGAFLMVRLTALKEVGLFDERFFIYGEEVDLCHRFHDCGWGVVYFPGVSVIHIGGASSSRNAQRFFCESFKSKRMYWMKHYGSLSQLAFVLISLLHQIRRISSSAIGVARNQYTGGQGLAKTRASLCILAHLLTWSGR
jgi:GT2 family glycosyltransferase